MPMKVKSQDSRASNYNPECQIIGQPSKILEAIEQILVYTNSGLKRRA